MSILQANGAGLGGKGDPGGALGSFYTTTIDQSLRFNNDDNAYLEFTPSSAGNRDTWTISMWVKRSGLGLAQSKLFAAGSSFASNHNNSFYMWFQSDDTLRIFNESGGSYFTRLDTSRVFRDTAAWYHIVYVYDSTQAIATDRQKLYINGVQETAFDLRTDPGLNVDSQVNATHVHRIGASTIGNTFDGYMAEVNFIDGTALDSDSFGEIKNGVWVPKEYNTADGAYGTNGFYLPFAQDSSSGASAFFDEDDNSYVAWTDPGTEYVIGTSDDYTLELFFNPTSTEMSGSSYIAGYYRSTSPSGYFAAQLNIPSNVIYLYYGNGQAYSFSITSGDIVEGQWHHLAFNRSSGNLRCFLDGAQKGSTQASSASHDIPEFRVNKAHATSNVTFDGYISNVRLVIGSAVYADGTTITVPTSTLTAVTNTKILACTTTTVTADASSNNVTGTTSGGTVLGNNVSPFADFNFYDDNSGNTNNFTANNLLPSDVVPDSPTNNMAVLSSANKYTNATSDDVREGGLEERGNSSGYAGTVTFDATDTDGYYFEVTHTGTPGTGCTHGMMNFTDSINQYGGIPGDSDRSGWWGVYRRGAGGSDQFWYYLDGVETATLGVAGAANDVWMYLIKDGKFYIGRNGTWFNSADPSAGTGHYASGLTGTDWTIFSGNGSNVTGGHKIRVDRNLWDYGDASYKEIKASNIADPTIGPGQSNQADDYFETITYIGNGATQHIGSGGAQHPVDVTTINNSLRFSNTDNSFLSYQPGANGDTQIMTYSGWIKLAEKSEYHILLQAVDSQYDSIWVQNSSSGSKLQVILGSTSTAVVSSTRALTNTSKWTHICVNVDTTQATASDRIKVWIDGVQETLTGTQPTQNAPFAAWFKSGITHRMNFEGGSTYGNGYVAEVHVIEGTTYDYTYFGQVGSNGYWIPKAVSGITYGDEGFYLNFSDNSTASALGTDSSGNTPPNNFSVTSVETTDQMGDSPTQNFNTLNPNGTNFVSYAVTLSEGNLKASALQAKRVNSMLGVSSGKWYFETKSQAGDPMVGIALRDGSDSIVYDGNAGYVRNYAPINGTAVNRTGYATWTTTDIIGVAFDVDNNQVEFFKNNTSIGTFDFNMKSETVATAGYQGGTNVQITFNFGADDSFAGEATGGAGAADGNGYGSFYYTPPTGYLAMVDDNIPQEGLAAPDFVWIKNRDVAADHYLVDSVRGDYKQLISNSTATESTNTSNGVKLGYDGFTVGALGDINSSGKNYVSWNWKAGGSSNTFNIDGTGYSTASAASLDGGDITPTGASINTAAGFSIIGYTGNGGAITGQTIKHGLDSAPQLIFIKDRDTNSNSNQFHASSSIIGDDYGYLSTAAGFTGAALMKPTSGDDTTVTLGIGSNTNVRNSTNESGDKFIMYCFHSVPGYSAVGKYVGNGIADGTFVYTGFRPVWVMTKRTDGTSWWGISDAARSTYNEVANTLAANENYNESTLTSDLKLDFLSNGFKIRDTDGYYNASGGSYIYLAFAEAPFKYANAR